MKDREDILGKNTHYSMQTGHYLRGVHETVVKKLGGNMPEGIAGYRGIEGIEQQRIRRSMRRITSSGR